MPRNQKKNPFTIQKKKKKKKNKKKKTQKTKNKLNLGGKMFLQLKKIETLTREIEKPIERCSWIPLYEYTYLISLMRYKIQCTLYQISKYTH